MTTGKRIAQKRKEMNLTQESFGEKLGVSRQSVYRWEQDVTLPEIETLLQMSKIFDVSVDWLLGKEDNMAAVDKRGNNTTPAKMGFPFLQIVAVILIAGILVSVLLMGVQISALRKSIAELKDQIAVENGQDPTVSEPPETTTPGGTEPPTTTETVPDVTLDPEIALDPGQLVGEYVPVIRVEVKPGQWGGKDDVRVGTMFWEGADGQNYTYTIKIKPQGSSSLAYDKKNFTVNLLDGAMTVMDYWGEQTEFCWKANYIDPTHAGNVVSARLAGQMNKKYSVLSQAPNGGSVDGIPVWLCINDEAVGLYTWCIPKAAWMFGMEEENENHIVMCGEGPLPGCQFISEGYIPDEEWSVEVGTDEDYAFEKFDRLYQFINASTNEEFKADFDQYLDLDACLNYYCYAMVSNAQDNMDNNLLLATYDGEIWAPALYDLDSLWGVQWDGKETVVDTAICVAQNEGVLWTKLRECFGDELKQRYAELRSDILSEENIWNAFEEFIGSIPYPYYDYDTAMWNADGEMIRSLDLMKQCVSEYLPQVDAEMGYSAP